MASAAALREQIESLLGESEDIESRVSKWQTDAPPDMGEIHRVQREYHDWFGRARKYVPASEEERFRDMYEGGMVIQRIKGFLNEPLAINQFYDPANPNPFVSEWQHPFQDTFQKSFATQREILVLALHEIADTSAVLDELEAVFSRLPECISILQFKDNPRVPAPKIENEKDLQDLVHAILVLLYEDVRAEDLVPQHAGAGSRTDFLIREAGVLVETKMTRESLKDKKVGEELLVDWGRYPRHPDCRAIFALVYDPDRWIVNPKGLQHDLSQDREEPATRVLVVR